MLNPTNELKLNEAHAAWLTDISEKDLSEMFKSARHSRLQTLDNAKVDVTQGEQVQQEVAALHRLEKMFLECRQKALEAEKKQEK